MSDERGNPDNQGWRPPEERRSPWRLFLDRLGLRSKGKQLATHPERIGLK